jgi:hypothetical protein
MTVTPFDQPTHNRPTKASGRERLNAVDRAMRAVDCSLRWMNYPGFETQLLVWLSERLDVAHLRETLNRLALVEPAIVSRLEDHPQCVPHWHFEGQRAALFEATLGTDTKEAVLDYAAQHLAVPADPATNHPIRFHLIHRPHAPDVLLIQYNHTLVDHRGSIGLVQEMDWLGQGKRELPVQATRAADDPTRRYLLSFPRQQRRTAAKRALDVWWRAIKGGAATLGRPGRYSAPRQGLRVLVDRLDAEQTAALRARTIDACGFPAISMEILGAAFRSLDQLAGDHSDNRSWVAGIGTDLGLRRPGETVLHNLMSMVPIGVERSRLGCRDGLLRQLNEQMRSHLENQIDLGILQLMTIFARRPRQMNWAVDHCLAHGFSLWYAYFGSLDVIGKEFLGVPVEDIACFGPCWSPMGVTLLAHQFRGRLALQLTYLPELVSDNEAQNLLSLVRANLVDG